MITLLVLLACQPEKEPTDSVDTTPPTPDIWGVAAAEDLDPDPHVVEVHLTAAMTEVTWLDEDHPTEVMAYNGQVPGPAIVANVGDTVRVVLDNQLDQETTIHWHGLRVPDAMDGVPMVQDPVQPGESFTYEFVVGDPGSYWYHPHVRANVQVEQGLQGVLVVREAEPVAVDRERWFVIDDVLLEDDGDISPSMLGRNHMEQMHGRFGNTLLANGQTELLTDTVQPGAVERWRVVNTANARTMWVDVQGADWRVIGVDGGLLEEPFTAPRVQLPVGRRFDLEVIPTGDEDAVQLRVLLPSNGGGWDEFPVYEAAVEGEDLGGAPLDWQGPAAPEQRPTEQEVDLTFDASGGGTSINWTINGVTWDEHTPIEVQGNVPSLIRIHEASQAEHPFHLHGNFFQLVSVDGEPGTLPGLLDTWLVRGTNEVVLYTEFENPGRWMSHCHILEHAERGMMAELHVVE